MKPLLNIILKIFATILCVVALVPLMSISLLLWDAEYIELWAKMLDEIWSI